MGCTATDNGISVQFCHADGRPDGTPFYGRYAMLFGSSQDLVTGGDPLPEEQGKFRGSDEWLTLIAVDDTKEKLHEIVTDWKGACTPCHTSCSSHRACIDLRIGGVRQIFKDRITIASGPIVSLKPPIKIDVVHVKVLPAGTKLSDDHPLLPEFVGGSIALNSV